METQRESWYLATVFFAGCVSAFASMYIMKSVKKTKTIGGTFGTARNAISRAKWDVGSNQPIPYAAANWKQFSPNDLRKSGGIYGLMISTVVPRPIALVTSIDKDGVVNCAPFSYCGATCHDPPLITLGLCLNVRGGTKKDTLNNIEASGQLVINIMSAWFLESANHTSGSFAPDVDEVRLSGLSTLPSELVKAPRIGDAAVQLECEVFDLKPVFNDDHKHTVTIVTARVIRFHIHEDVLTDECKSGDSGSATADTDTAGVTIVKPVVDWKKLRPVGRLGGDTYTFVDNGYDLKRPR